MTATLAPDLLAITDALPMPALLVAADDIPCHLNQAWISLFGAGQDEAAALLQTRRMAAALAAVRADESGKGRYDFSLKAETPLPSLVSGNLQGAPLDVVIQVLAQGRLLVLLPQFQRQPQPQHLPHHRDVPPLFGILDTLDEGVMICDETLRLVMVNRRYRALMDLPEGLIRPGTPLEDQLSHLAEQGAFGSGQSAAQVAYRLIAARRREPGSEELHCNDGSVLRLVRTPLPDGGLSFSVADVTQMRSSEELLLRDEQEFRMFFDEAPFPKAISLLDGTLIRVNRRFAELLGYAPEEMFGCPLGAFTRPGGPSTVTAADASALPHGLAAEEAARGPQQALGRYFHKSGHVLEALLTLSPVKDREGRPLYFIAQLVDVTERHNVLSALQESEQRFRRLFDETPISLWEGDWSEVKRTFDQLRREGVTDFRSYFSNNLQETARIFSLLRFLSFNEATVKLYGATSRAQLWESLAGLWAVEENHPGLALVLAVMAEAKPGARVTSEIDRRILTGEIRRFRVIYQLPADPDSTWSRLVGVIEDVTDRHRAALELIAAKESAEEANNAKSDFLAKMSHELRTPLNAILGFSDLMRHELFGPLGAEKYRDYVRDIHDSGAHLLVVINNVLDLSKIEAGKFELQEAELDVAQVVGWAIRTVEVNARAGGLALSMEVAPNLPRLRADEHALKRVLLNLLSNAIKFTPENGRITASACRCEDGRLKLSVADTGIGISPENIEKVTEPFVQVDSIWSQRHEGTGIGLHITKLLAELHGGSLHIESTLGEGSTFSLLLPLDRLMET